MKLKFIQVDVFADRPLEGNSLAVFLDATGLEERQMQSIAREMNLSETTFVFPRDNATESSKGIRTRIFTVQEELPFAGHPTLGTAWVIRGERSEVVLDENVGSIPVRFSTENQNVFGEMTQGDPKWGMTHKASEVASAIGIEESDLDAGKPIETVSTGVPFTIVCFKSLDKLKSIRPNFALMDSYLKTTDSKYFYLVCRETENKEARMHARMIFYGGEDPATGSAAGTATAWMIRHKVIQPEERAWIEQGIEISRPSKIFVRAGGRSDMPTNIRVGGCCREVIEGELSL